ncbi:MAG: AbrB/MazE/SpoVT family DNA-binding domain-containing protein [Dehalococcoidia bacterium]
MPIATISSKNQITLPMEIIRGMGLKAGDKLAIELSNGRIVAVRQPDSWVDYIAGSAKGVYGGTKTAVDRYVAEERAWYGTRPQEATDDFEDYYVANQGGAAQAILDALARKRPLHTATAAELATETSTDEQRTTELLESILVPRQWVRRITAPDGIKYRLRRELADAIAAA